MFQTWIKRYVSPHVQPVNGFILVRGKAKVVNETFQKYSDVLLNLQISA